MTSDWKSYLASEILASVDANILVYAVTADHGVKHKVAVDVLHDVSESNGILALQTLGEFFNACVRKYRFDPRVMQAAVVSWQEVFPIAVSSPSALNAAMRAVISHSLSFWDAMLVSTVREAGVSLLFSEDMQHGQMIEGVRIINPFA